MENSCVQVSVPVNRYARCNKAEHRVCFRGVSHFRGKDKKERGRLTCCFTKFGLVYLQEYKPQISKLVLYSSSKELINTLNVNIYHLISTIFIISSLAYSTERLYCLHFAVFFSSDAFLSTDIWIRSIPTHAMCISTCPSSNELANVRGDFWLSE